MKIDGISILKEYGVGIMNTMGIFDLLKRKQPLKHNWSDRNGEDYFIESRDIVFEPRIIRLECFMVANSNAELENQFARFIALLDRPYLRTLEINNVDRPFMVYIRNGANVKILTHGIRSGRNIATFQLDLVEPDPIYPYMNAEGIVAAENINLRIRMHSGRLRIYWGDGESTECSDTVLTYVYHTYQNAGNYKISILEDYDRVYEFRANNAKFTGPVDSFLRAMNSSLLINLAGASMKYYNGGIIPVSLTSLDLSGCNFASSEDVNRILRSLINDGTYKLADRNGPMTVNLSGAGMPECTDWTSYDIADASLTINVNGVHP